MAESIEIDVSLPKEQKYQTLLPQIKALTESETDLVANLANISAALKYSMDFFWIGFYLVKENQLVLGPFQGTIACTRIAFNKGVCGACYRKQKTIIVPDVEAFPDHIACSSRTRSEIVVPVFKNGEVVMVLDADSTELNDYDAIDAKYLEEISAWIEQKLI
jgi:GAF domain-containing protein